MNGFSFGFWLLGLAGVGANAQTTQAALHDCESECGSSAVNHKIFMVDSWGDGWNGHKLTIVNPHICSKFGMYDGIDAITLTTGNSGNVEICIFDGAMCQDATDMTTMGSYSAEVSYYIAPSGNEGSENSICASGVQSQSNGWACSLAGETCCSPPNSADLMFKEYTLEIRSEEFDVWYNNDIEADHYIRLTDNLCAGSDAYGNPIIDFSLSDDHNAGSCGTGDSACVTEIPVAMVNNTEALAMALNDGLSAFKYFLKKNETVLAGGNGECGKLMMGIDNSEGGFCALCPCLKTQFTIHMYDSVGDGWDHLVLDANIHPRPVIFHHQWGGDPVVGAYTGYTPDGYFNNNNYNVQGRFELKPQHRWHIPYSLYFEPFVEVCGNFFDGWKPYVPTMNFAWYPWGSPVCLYDTPCEEFVPSTYDMFGRFFASKIGVPHMKGYHYTQDFCANQTVLDSMTGGFLALGVGGVNNSQNTFEIMHNETGNLWCAGNGPCGECILGQLNISHCTPPEDKTYCSLSGAPWYVNPSRFVLQMHSTNAAKGSGDYTMAIDKSILACSNYGSVEFKLEAGESFREWAFGMSETSVNDNTTSILVSTGLLKELGDESVTFSIVDTENNNATVCAGRGDCGECIPTNTNASVCSIPTCEYCNENGEECETKRTNHKIALGFNDYAHHAWKDVDGNPVVMKISYGCALNATGDSVTTVSRPSESDGILTSSEFIAGCSYENTWWGWCYAPIYHAYIDKTKTYCTGKALFHQDEDQEYNDFWGNYKTYSALSYSNEYACHYGASASGRWNHACPHDEDDNDDEAFVDGEEYTYCPEGADTDGGCWVTNHACVYGTNPDNYKSECRKWNTNDLTCPQYTTSTTTPPPLPTTTTTLAPTTNEDSQIQTNSADEGGSETTEAVDASGTSELDGQTTLAADVQALLDEMEADEANGTDDDSGATADDDSFARSLSGGFSVLFLAWVHYI